MAKSILLSDEEISFVTSACEQFVRQMNAYQMMTKAPMPAEVQATVLIATALSHKLGVDIEVSAAPISSLEITAPEPSPLNAQMDASLELQRQLSANASTRIERIVTALLPCMVASPEQFKGTGLIDTVKNAVEVISLLEHAYE